MIAIPESRTDEKEILRKQLALIAEKSKSCGTIELCLLTESMVQIVKQLSQS